MITAQLLSGTSIAIPRIFLALVYLVPYVILSLVAPNAHANQYATLTLVVDSLGNETTLSVSGDNASGWSCEPNCPDLSLTVGETLVITAEATDPNNRPLQYQFTIENNVVQDWSSSSTFTWNIAPGDYNKFAGVRISVRNDDGMDYQGEYIGDDYASVIYEVLDPNHPPAYLTSVSDSLGNSNTNSWGTTLYGGWSCDPNCPRLVVNIGETITLQASAADPKGRPLEFRFEMQSTKSGGSGIVQDWSTNNTYVWTVIPDLAGQHVVFAIRVRNNDGMYLFGNSDDYTYAAYDIPIENVHSPVISRFSDSLGNWTTYAYPETTPGTSCYPNCPGMKLFIGQTITMNAEATDPLGKELQYRFSIQTTSMPNEIVQDWSTNNTFIWHISPKYYGQNNIVTVEVRNNDGYTHFSDYDSYTSLIYTVENGEQIYFPLLMH